MEEDDEIPPATFHLPDVSALTPLAQAEAEVGGGWNTGNLKYEHWREVVEIVSMAGFGEYGKTNVQCKNRIDTVKKRYKQEKTRKAAGGGPSSWVFFEKLDRLIGATANFPSSGCGRRRGESFQKVPMGIHTNSRSNLYQRQMEQQALVKRCSKSTPRQFRSESDSETSGDSEDSLPPPLMLPPEKRFKIDKMGGGREMTELARATLRFIEVYEKAEREKLKQTAEMEKERMKFLKEIESQRMQFLKAHMEITQIKLEIMKMKNM
ncbi:PREDICTED: trihelix transcription factor ASIL1-like [Tarenaya hassleriana]|uniref:trihelix transcription factor ASIL1-like n=1 Tax=Tarenaya hassleriana TaxID=28532 RepID=UPI00053C8D82|nr:PREDICTED: trihelix transcription factor ASIL1-like [Tarenaya hassleriana]